MLPRVGESGEGSAQDVKSGDLIKDNIEFTEHYFSNYVAAKTILSSAEKYGKLAKQKIPSEKIDKLRAGMITELKWD